GWFVEGAALIRVSRRWEADYVKQLAGLALLLGTLRLLGVDQFNTTQLFFNHRIMTFGIAIAALADVARNFAIAGKEDDRRLLAVVIVMINFFALVALTHEITDAWRRQLQAASPGG